MPTITIDFDNTLTRPYVQTAVKEWIDRGIDVWILTARYDELHKHLYHQNPKNDEVYEIAKEVGIERHKIIFCNMKSKADYLRGTNVLFHLDDSSVELQEILDAKIKTIPLSVFDDWKWKAEALLNSQCLGPTIGEILRDEKGEVVSLQELGKMFNGNMEAMQETNKSNYDLLYDYLEKNGFESDAFGCFWHHPKCREILEEDNGLIYYYSCPPELYGKDLGLSIDENGDEYIKTTEDVDKLVKALNEI